MDGTRLAFDLAAGRSIEAIAREAGRDPSTVAYWVNKHGLASSHAPRHAARGGIERETLAALVEQGRSIRQIAAELGVSYTTVRHWLKRYGLRTQPARYARADDPKHPGLLRECSTHGWTTFILVGEARMYRCARCAVETVAERRRVLKQTLVEEAGGRCALCGYDRFAGALHFHHRDPSLKAFALSNGGRAQSLETLRAEARKCVLLCANCHAEVEGGRATVR